MQPERSARRRGSRGAGSAASSVPRLAPHIAYTYSVRVAPTSEQINAFLVRLRRAIAESRIQVRAYALDGLRDLEWNAADLRLQLLALTVDDLLRVESSTAPQGGLVWVFTPEFWDGGFLWIRLVERAGVVVISFHKG